ncbi:MAG TPA: WecB/TagA/CpsF family glycosyltransferase [Candidatus Moranbacteria bacterium]|nr:WecB/TagA/CpsF family glycosyltransferase [Candidatus Moranbacteria bacterium]
MHILGVRIDNFLKEEILEKIESFLGEEKLHRIATVNPEMVLLAQERDEFREVLNTCDLNVADGIGIKFAFLRQGGKLKCRFAGADLMHAVLGMAQKRGMDVFLAARKDGLSSWQETAAALRKKYPRIEFSGDNIDLRNLSSYRIPDAGYQLLLCSFGAPSQELFISRIKNDKIRLAIGVGGAFDFATGKIRRAPLFMRVLGLEWLWRLALEPSYRAKRVLGAVMLFPFKIIFGKKYDA